MHLWQHCAKASTADGHRGSVVCVLAISHCWLDPNHTDEHGYLLEILAPAMRCYLDEVNKIVGGGFEGAVFFAWCSLHQPYHERTRQGYRKMTETTLTERERKAWSTALENMDIWYTHAQTEKWLLTKYFEGQGYSYHQRGWPAWESTVTFA